MILRTSKLKYTKYLCQQRCACGQSRVGARRPRRDARNDDIYGSRFTQALLILF